MIDETNKNNFNILIVEKEDIQKDVCPDQKIDYFIINYKNKGL